jgi:hypothetical protein
MSISEEITKTEKEAAAKLEEIEHLKKLEKNFPDIKKHIGRWNKVAYYSKTINEKADRFDKRYNCGCCNDSPLEIWPYLETEFGKIYTDPPVFRVGEKHWISGSVPYKNWEKNLIEAGIQESVIGAIQMHFEYSNKERLKMAEDANETQRGSNDDDY